MANTVYGRALLEYGEVDQALEQLDKAIGARMEESGLRKTDTGERYYFAPARLTLGKYYLERDKLLDAVAHFELARAYAVPADTEYGDFHSALYRAYAAHGLWARALEFGEPSDQELEGLDTRDMLTIARVCEGEHNWILASRLAGRLLARGAFVGEAHHLLGRVELAAERYEDSLVHLEQAVLSGHSRSAFFLGTAFEKTGQTARALQAFLRTPSGDIYRPFALAKVLTLMDNFPNDAQTVTTPTRQELLGQLDQEIAGLRLLARPIAYDKHGRLSPIAVITSELHFAAGGRFPILMLWEDGQAPGADPTRVSFSSSGPEDSLLLLQRANSILQLQWVENLVNWESVELLQSGATVIPGWIDTARDWFGLRPDHATMVHTNAAGDAFLSIDKLSWVYSVPVRVRGGVGYLLTGRLRGPGSGRSIAWQFLDEEERVLFENDILGQETSDAWTWHAGYMRSEPHWDAVRVQFNVMRNTGTVAFDDVMLVEVSEPDPAFLD